MLIIFNGADIAGRPNERALSRAVFDPDQYQVVRETLSEGYGVYQIDETTLDSQTLAVDIYNRLGDVDFRGLGKYYVRVPARTLWVRGGWRPASQGTYTPTDDVLMTPARSAEFSAFDDGHAATAARLGEIAQGIVLPAVAVRDLADALIRVENLLYRQHHPPR